MLRYALVIFFCFGLLIPRDAHSADGKNKLGTWTEVPTDDPDYPFQGEYLGSAINDCRQCESIGLQVVAMGDASFSAVKYRGGLPGYGWPAGGERSKFQGTREGDVLTLTGEHQQITIQNGHARIKLVGDYSRQIGTAGFVKRQSATLGACRPCNAIAVFDGTSTELLKNGQMTDDGLLKEGTETRDAYGDFRLHLEFRLPYMPKAKGQGRANSGIYVQSRYEVQVLDSFGLEGEFNECGALYREVKPNLNMCLPPLSWQTYDIWFRAPRFDADGKKTTNAQFTVWLNGVAIHENLDLATPTGGGKRVGEGSNALPTKIQNHSNPIRFRNIWLVHHSSTDNCCNQQIAASAENNPLAGLLERIGYSKN
jgi:hypothetical protein